jgi:hypothetical protein
MVAPYRPFPLGKISTVFICPSAGCDGDDRTRYSFRSSGAGLDRNATAVAA